MPFTVDHYLKGHELARFVEKQCRFFGGELKTFEIVIPVDDANTTHRARTFGPELQLLGVDRVVFAPWHKLND